MISSLPDSRSDRSLSSQLRSARQRGELGLIASLPSHDLAYVEAAMRGGAHALKLHFGLTHRASGQIAPTLRHCQSLISQVRELAPNLPIGAVLGETAQSVAQDLELAHELGLDFISGYVQSLPARVYNSGLEVLLAFNDETPPSWAAQLPSGVLLEASVTPHAHYAEPLTAADILRYRTLRAITTAPLIVPTQKYIDPADAALLFEYGIDALMYGVIVTGEEADGFERLARAYRGAFNMVALP